MTQEVERTFFTYEMTRIRNIAKADFIIRACNAHYALVEAFWHMLDALKGVEVTGEYQGACIYKAEEALNLARGES